MLAAAAVAPGAGSVQGAVVTTRHPRESIAAAPCHSPQVTGQRSQAIGHQATRQGSGVELRTHSSKVGLASIRSKVTGQRGRRSQNAVDQSSAPHHQLVLSTHVYHLPLALLFMAMPNFREYLQDRDGRERGNNTACETEYCSTLSPVQSTVLSTAELCLHHSAMLALHEFKHHGAVIDATVLYGKCHAADIPGTVAGDGNEGQEQG